MHTNTLGSTLKALISKGISVLFLLIEQDLLLTHYSETAQFQKIILKNVKVVLLQARAGSRYLALKGVSLQYCKTQSYTAILQH